MVWPFNRPAPVAVEQKSLGDPTAELLELFGAMPAGTSISNAEALSVPAVSAAVRIISEAAASLDISVKRRVGDAEENVVDHPGLKLLTGQANGWTSGYELIRDLVAAALTKDVGGLAYVTSVGGEPREIIIYRDSIITYDLDDKTNEPRYRLGNQTVSASNVLHLRGPFSKSPMSLARGAVSMAKAMEDYANGLWSNGARPGGVIETPNKLGNEGVKAMLAGWKAAFSGKANAGKTAILYEGASYRQMALTSVDGQFNESRTFQILEIARAFRVPPGMLFELSRNTWSNSEQQAKEFISYALVPWLRALESAFNRTLLSDEERGEFRFAFDIDDTSQADLTARATAISTLITARVLNPNEARDWLGMPPRDGGNEFANPAIDTAKPAANDNTPAPKEATIVAA
ncbi:phage portal protein [Rhizobium leguminosarum]|nr:phage portal protein [Rhizobium leguminosarum]MBY2969310.1 phage portal protein [Rhizobium leguminosarum]MBY2976683.1 phage portal protein [Rhizobium leguminosarum]MBY3005234.1 phage portal protein [Rhizobium leguminosarum]